MTDDRDLLERLDEAGSIGLDLSPGDPLCREAASEIRRLLVHCDAWNKIVNDTQQRTESAERVVEVARGEWKRVNLVDWQTPKGLMPKDVYDIIHPIIEAVAVYDKVMK